MEQQCLFMVFQMRKSLKRNGKNGLEHAEATILSAERIAIFVAFISLGKVDQQLKILIQYYQS